MALYEHPSNQSTPPSHIVGSMVKTPLTGVDANTSFTLSFAPEAQSGSTLSAQAILSTSINLPSVEPGATIRYEHGDIIIAQPIYAPREFTVKYHKSKEHDGECEAKVVKSDWVGSGWHFQADEVARCVSAGKLQSIEWGWDKSLLEMKIFDEVSGVYGTNISKAEMCCRCGSRVDTCFQQASKKCSKLDLKAIMYSVFDENSRLFIQTVLFNNPMKIMLHDAPSFRRRLLHTRPENKPARIHFRLLRTIPMALTHSRRTQAI